MEHLLEILNRIELVEKRLNKSYSPRLIINLDGSVSIGWKDIHERRNTIYAAHVNNIGNISEGFDKLAENLENWALEAYEKDNVYG